MTRLPRKRIEHAATYWHAEAKQLRRAVLVLSLVLLAHGVLDVVLWWLP